MLGRFRLAFAGLLCSALVAFAAADPPIRLPVAPPVPLPMPQPAPPGGSLALDGSMVAIIDADIDCLIIESVPGLVKIDTVKGPRDVTAIFAGGTGTDEDRSFTGKNLYRVKAAGKGTVTLSIVPVGVKSRDEIKTLTFDVDATVGRRKPCPDPKPVDPPAPKPVDPVTPVTSFRVIVVFESADALTADQRGVLYGRVVEEWLTANCTGGKNGWRRRDKDAPGEADATMAALWAAVQPKVTTTPCVAVEVNGKVEIIPPGATPADMVATLKKYREGK